MGCCREEFNKAYLHLPFLGAITNSSCSSYDADKKSLLKHLNMKSENLLTMSHFI